MCWTGKQQPSDQSHHSSVTRSLYDENKGGLQHQSSSLRGVLCRVLSVPSTHKQADRGALFHQLGPPLPAPTTWSHWLKCCMWQFFSVLFSIGNDDLTRFESNISASGVVGGGLYFRWVVPVTFASLPPSPLHHCCHGYVKRWQRKGFTPKAEPAVMDAD